jgi:hypothetical protein
MAIRKIYFWWKWNTVTRHSFQWQSAVILWFT